MYEKHLKPFFKKLVPYILVVLIMIIINNFIVRTSGNTTFINNFNFASTLVSIMLSLIAIFYTFIDGAESKVVQNKIIESSEEIKKSSQDLKSINSIIDEFKKELKKTENNIIENNTLRNNAFLKEFQEEVPKSKNDDSKSLFINNENIGKFISSSSDGTLLIIYGIIRSYECKKDIDTNDIIFDEKKYLNNNIFPVVDILRALNFISADSKGYVIKIKSVKSEFLEIVKKEFGSRDFSNLKIISVSIENLEKYFG